MIVVAGVGGGSLQGFSQGQGTTAFSGAEFVDIPVPQGPWWTGRSRRPSRFLAKTGVQQRAVEQTMLTLQFLKVVAGREVFSVFAQTRIQLLHPHALFAVDEPFQGFFFSHFSPEEKSAGLGPHSGSELGADFNPWTPAAYAESVALDDDESEGGVGGGGGGGGGVQRLALQLAFGFCGSARGSGAPDGAASVEVCLWR